MSIKANSRKSKNKQLNIESRSIYHHLKESIQIKGFLKFLQPAKNHMRVVTEKSEIKSQ